LDNVMADAQTAKAASSLVTVMEVEAKETRASGQGRSTFAAAIGRIHRNVGSANDRA
jgi:hypothetical protein